MCEESKGAPVGSLESPAAKGLGPERLELGLVCVPLLDRCVNAQAAASPLTGSALASPLE